MHHATCLWELSVGCGSSKGVLHRAAEFVLEALYAGVWGMKRVFWEPSLSPARSSALASSCEGILIAVLQDA